MANILSVDTYKLGTYIDIKTGTLNRRLRDGTLTTAESDRLFHFTEVHDAPFDLFEDDKVQPINGYVRPPSASVVMCLYT